MIKSYINATFFKKHNRATDSYHSTYPGNQPENPSRSELSTLWLYWTIQPKQNQ